MEGGAEVMTLEQQRIAIAEACGWEYCRYIEGLRNVCGIPPNSWKGNYISGLDVAWTPDYLNDLNAMHEAEKILPDNNQMKFRGELVDMMRPKYGFESACLLAIHATAAQRAEAFLRTTGKWEIKEL